VALIRTAAQPIACKQGSYAFGRSGSGAQTKSSSTPICFWPQAVGVRLADDLPGTGSRTCACGVSVRLCGPDQDCCAAHRLQARLLRLRQKRIWCADEIESDANLLLAAGRGSSTPICFWPQAVGVRLADDLPGTGSKSCACGVSVRLRRPDQDCCAAHRLQARLLRLRQKRIWCADEIEFDADLLLAAGRRSPACRRSAGHRQ
jgi:hypothetical protein